MIKDEKILSLIKEYEEVEIPEKLSQTIKESIDMGEEELLKERLKRKRSRDMKRRIVGTAAALVITVGAFGVGVNASPVFAETVSTIPVLNSLARVFTAEKVHEETDSYVADMNIPGIEGLKDVKLQKEINDLVKSQVTSAVDETKVLMKEYRKAYVETGGTEADYMPRDISVDYEVKCLNDNILSFSVYKTETLASAYFDMFYYNYDLKTSKPITLEGMLGSDYKEVANKQIKQQIAERSKVEGNIYWDGSEGEEGFKSITDNQQFYVNEAGNPVIIFNKYEIAPGFMGIQEFEVTK